MRGARLLLTLVIVICGASRASAARMDGFVFLYPINSESFRSWGQAKYLDDLNAVAYNAVLSGTHSVHGAQISIPLLHRIVALNLLYEEGETYDYNGNEMYLISSYEVHRSWNQTELRTMADVEFLYIPN